MGRLGSGVRAYMPFYVGDWLADADVTRMSLEEQGAYFRLLCYQWREGSVPDDPAELAPMLRVSPKEAARLWQAIRPRFRVRAGRARQFRAAHERAQAIRRSEKLSRAGMRGGQVSAERRLSDTARLEPGSSKDNQARLNQSSSSSSSSSVQQKDSPNGESVGSPDPTARTARELVEYWKDRYHPQAHVTKERVQKVRARLKTFDPDELRQVIDQVCKDPWWLGDNDRHTDFSFPESFMKNDAQVDKFLTKAREASQPSTSKPRGTAACVKCGIIHARSELRVQDPPICQACS